TAILYFHSQTTFVVDETTTVIKEETIYYMTSLLSQLTKLGKPFKYMGMVTGHLNYSLHTAGSCFWDNSIDGSCMVPRENESLYCIVRVFGVAI
uniref:Dynein light chain n=1 Tax=Cyprinus carpio TaxID=7962 RepID=A0A8C1Y3P1_CYPCA